ncbi:MAG: signal peptide peptidase SppA [Deltaproteobacteria bacterium]|nr:signal peptide peptidase SppA [Deltaproteobacteria bacterium]
MDKRAIVVLGVIFGGLFLVFFGFLALAMVSGPGTGPSLGSGPRIGVIEVTDAIMDSKQTLEDLKAFREDKAIKAILVRIDSPGGAVAPSQEIHDAILGARKEKKVVVSMANTAASGGYYIAVAADEIIANPGTVTGSIGVISQFTIVKDLVEWAKVDVETIKSGALKDAGSPFREMSEEERSYWQALVMDIYEQFVGAVAAGRKMDPEKVRAIADGRVLTGKQAKEAGLVDALGGFDFAVERTAELAGLEGKPRLVYPEKDEQEVLRELLAGGARSMTKAALSELELKLRDHGRGPNLMLLAR